MDPKEQAEFDQAAATLGDSFPPLWYRLYEQCCKQGFSEPVALRLVETYILSQCPSGVNLRHD